MRTAPRSYLRHPLNVILQSESAVRVLRELVLHGGTLAPSTLALRTRITRAMVHRTLGKLLETGIVGVVGQGRNLAYQLSLTHPFTPALMGLFDAELKRVEALWAAVTTAAAAGSEPARAVWLFGSVARNEDGVRSDCDIALVYADDEVVESAVSSARLALQPIEAEARVALSVIGLSYADVRRLGGSGDPLWQSLKRDGLALGGPSPDSLLTTLRVTEKFGAPTKHNDEVSDTPL
ncbi:hypothetical protein BH11GEM2_BH11GEM2_30600 [soil metagenome]